MLIAIYAVAMVHIIITRGANRRTMDGNHIKRSIYDLEVAFGDRDESKTQNILIRNLWAFRNCVRVKVKV